MTQIHAMASVDPAAQLAEDVEIGPFAVVGPNVVIGKGTRVGPQVRISGLIEIGKNNNFVGSASIGTDPQDLKYGGEDTRLVIGDGNTVREFVTINRGTAGGGGLTTIGSENLFMAYTHVAHDCHVGSGVVFANGATLAGHVEIADFSTIGAFSAVHQFCRVGRHAFIGADSIITQDVLPFVKTVGARPAKTYGVNTLGLERKGFSKESILALKRAYRFLVRAHLSQGEAIEKIEKELKGVDEVDYLIEFVKGVSARGFIH